jgi:hypothetical protein
VAGRKRGRLDYADADGVAFEAICDAIETYDPKKAKLGTWIGVKVKGLLTRTRRELAKQQPAELDHFITDKNWIKPARVGGENPKGRKCACGLVWIPRPDIPQVPLAHLLFPLEDLYVILKPGKRPQPLRDPLVAYGKGVSEIVRIEREEIDKRHCAREHYNKLEPYLRQQDRLEAWLKRRKGVNREDQKIARLLFEDYRSLSWTVTIGRKEYKCWVNGTRWLPSEVAEELGITISKLNAAVARICKTVTGKSEQELIAEHDAREDQIRATPVPPPMLPRSVQRELKALPPEPTLDEASVAVCRYWLDCIVRVGSRDHGELWAFAKATAEPTKVGDLYRGGIGLPVLHGSALQEIADRVADGIRDKAGTEYACLGECCAIIKRHR